MGEAMRTGRARWMVATAALALVSVACGSNDGDGTDTPGTTNGVTVTGSPSGTTAIGSSSGCTETNATDLTGDDPFTITTKALAFKPDCLMVSSAASITLVNKEGLRHNFHPLRTDVTLDFRHMETFEGGPLGLPPGSYDFVCTIHPSMTGTIIVV